MINKADAADPMVLARLRQREPHSVVVSAKTGEGIAEALAVVETELPRPDVEFQVLLPYERGDLINRLHQQGEIDSMEHTGDGTLVRGRANEDLAGRAGGVRRRAGHRLTTVRSIPGREPVRTQTFAVIHRGPWRGCGCWCRVPRPGPGRRAGLAPLRRASGDDDARQCARFAQAVGRPGVGRRRLRAPGSW